MIRLFKITGLVLVMLWGITLGGCGPAVGGSRFWWNDQERKQMPADYALPAIGQDNAETGASENRGSVEAAVEKAPVVKNAASKKNSAAGAVPKGLQ